ncbi:unnamed protein product [Vitrella brassicaformis CCMP3155]|uniref:Apple domain-containing protein n=1 Tax=Vitrella brassicaformis (strain CCMP3155) TaxID=1169540 RepID=A0A0G4FAX9_VITBC|nr:unnamed protein product [Vitrella brassicaformis CCMP3155]|eukprot:CEM10077.1 unnamed protein product [Vitrella brassicaformis CCMP3155]
MCVYLHVFDVGGREGQLQTGVSRGVSCGRGQDRTSPQKTSGRAQCTNRHVRSKGRKMFWSDEDEDLLEDRSGTTERDEDACCERCERTSGCVAYSYMLRSGKCYVRRDITHINKWDFVVSGIMKCS